MLHTAAVTHLKKETWNRKRETEKQRISFALMRELAAQDKTGPVPTGNTVSCVGTAKIKTLFGHSHRYARHYPRYVSRHLWEIR
jgi:hypothetical protein